MQHNVNFNNLCVNVTVEGGSEGSVNITQDCWLAAYNVKTDIGGYGAIVYINDKNVFCTLDPDRAITLGYIPVASGSTVSWNQHIVGAIIAYACN